MTHLAQQSERDFQRAVIEYARLNSWLVAHFHDSRRQVGDQLVGDKDAAGFPDLVLARGDQLIFAELKAEAGTPTARQREWLLALLGVELAVPRNIAVRLWRPSRWPEIERELRAYPATGKRAA